MPGPPYLGRTLHVGGGDLEDRRRLGRDPDEAENKDHVGGRGNFQEILRRLIIPALDEPAAPEIAGGGFVRRIAGSRAGMSGLRAAFPRRGVRSERRQTAVQRRRQPEHGEQQGDDEAAGTHARRKKRVACPVKPAARPARPAGAGWRIPPA